MKRAFQYVTHYGSANQEFADASVRRYEQKGVLRAGVPSPSPQSSCPFSLPPYPLPPTPFDACYAGYGMKDLKRKDLKKPKRSEKQTVKSQECICQIEEDLAPKKHPKKNKTETL